MNKTKLSLYIVILLLVAIAIFAFARFSSGLFEINDAGTSKKELEELSSKLASKEVALFWIGDVPSYIQNTNINNITLDKNKLSQETLPFKSYDVTYIIPVNTDLDSEEEEDNYANLEKYSVKEVEGYCPENSIIIINNVSDLTSSDYQLIIRSLDTSDTELIIIGEDAVKAFREYLFLPTGDSIQYYSMKCLPHNMIESGVLEDAKDMNVNSIDWTMEFLELIDKDTVMVTTH
ncbi:MAG: hypothetical protein MJ166_02090 [Clostridia bacterium]|nr:hypothetical protein [Clostridia bacterium]